MIDRTTTMTMTQRTTATVSRQNAEQLPDRRAMSTIDPTGLEANAAVVSLDDGLHVVATVDGNDSDVNGSEFHGSQSTTSVGTDDTPLTLGTSVSATDSDNSATGLSALLQLDDNNGDSALGLGNDGDNNGDGLLGLGSDSYNDGDNDGGGLLGLGSDGDNEGNGLGIDLSLSTTGIR